MAQGHLIAVPIGSCEQHGHHLPLSTDTLLATALVERLVAARGDTIAAPALPYGASGEHSGFPGTLSIGTDVLATVLVELRRSADHWRGVVLVNGHGGNAQGMHRAVTTLTAEGRPTLGWSPSLPGADAHAGRTETSLLLAIAPHHVALERAVAGVTQPLRELWPQLRERGVAAVTANGVLGDPAGATAEEGRRLLGALAADLIGAVEARFGPAATAPVAR